MSIYEQPTIVLWCHKYLHRMRKNRIDKRHVVYLDETWANAHDGHTKSWVEVDDSNIMNIYRIITFYLLI